MHHLGSEGVMLACLWPGLHETVDEWDDLLRNSNDPPNAAEQAGLILCGLAVLSDFLLALAAQDPRHQRAAHHKERGRGLDEIEGFREPAEGSLDLFQIRRHGLPVQIAAGDQVLLLLLECFYFRCSHSWSLRNSSIVAENGGASCFIRARARKYANTASPRYTAANPPAAYPRLSSGTNKITVAVIATSAIKPHSTAVHTQMRTPTAWFFSSRNSSAKSSTRFWTTPTAFDASRRVAEVQPESLS